MALNLLRNEKSTKVGIAAKRKWVGWNQGHLLKVLQNYEAIALSLDCIRPLFSGTVLYRSGGGWLMTSVYFEDTVKISIRERSAEDFQ